MDEDEEAQHRASVGKRIAALRVAKGLTQPQLAHLAGISQPSLWDIEAGETKRVTANTFVGLCRALSTTWDYLWDGGANVLAEADAQAEAELVAIFRSLKPPARGAFIDAARMARGVHDALTTADTKALSEESVPKPKGRGRVRKATPKK